MFFDRKRFPNEISCFFGSYEIFMLCCIVFS
jgi:hypothetical protein